MCMRCLRVPIQGDQDGQHGGDDVSAVCKTWQADPILTKDACMRRQDEERKLEEDFRPNQRTKPCRRITKERILERLHVPREHIQERFRIPCVRKDALRIEKDRHGNVRCEEEDQEDVFQTSTQLCDVLRCHPDGRSHSYRRSFALVSSANVLDGTSHPLSKTFSRSTTRRRRAFKKISYASCTHAMQQQKTTKDGCRARVMLRRERRTDHTHEKPGDLCTAHWIPLVFVPLRKPEKHSIVLAFLRNVSTSVDWMSPDLRRFISIHACQRWWNRRVRWCFPWRWPARNRKTCPC